MFNGLRDLQSSAKLPERTFDAGIKFTTAIGVQKDGKRTVLGLSTALSEAEVHWREFLMSLAKRGIHGLEMITSDDHKGLAAARKAVFASVPWQRCQLHLQ